MKEYEKAFMTCDGQVKWLQRREKELKKELKQVKTQLGLAVHARAAAKLKLRENEDD